MSRPIGEENPIHGVADAMQIISCGRPEDLIQYPAESHEPEGNPAAKDATRHDPANPRMAASGRGPSAGRRVWRTYPSRRHGAACPIAVGGTACPVSKVIRSTHVPGFGDPGPKAIHRAVVEDIPVPVAVVVDSESTHRDGRLAQSPRAGSRGRGGRTPRVRGVINAEGRSPRPRQRPCENRKRKRP